jgi:NhaC family Na+:H+ antiporter
MVAGAIISGAYFGDKMSPLSDTTNLAPAMAGTDLFTHIRHMMYTTVPAIIMRL